MDVREKLAELLERAFESFIDDPYCIPDEREFADHLIAHGVTVQEWISVKDRLPEVGDSYLVVVKYKYDHEKEYNYDTDVATYYPYDNPSAYIDERWDTYNDWDEGQQYLHITHWMPLPEPPKGLSNG